MIPMLILGSSLNEIGFSSLQILLLVSPMLVFTVGWGLVKKRRWARGGSILLMLFGFIFVFYQYWFLGTHLIGVPVIIVILGILFFSKNQSQSTLESDETSTLTSTMDTI